MTAKKKIHSVNRFGNLDYFDYQLFKNEEFRYFEYVIPIYPEVGASKNISLFRVGRYDHKTLLSFLSLQWQDYFQTLGAFPPRNKISFALKTATILSFYFV